jgi:hypothetical protein
VSPLVKKAIGPILVGVLAFSACSNLVKSLAGLNALQAAIHQKYHDEVNVKLHNSAYLNIVFINSALNNEDWHKRFARAQDTARFTALNYQDIRSVSEIWVSFVAAETRFIVFHYTRGLNSFGFYRNGTPLQPEQADQFHTTDTVVMRDDPLATVVQFSADTNQSDVSIMRIQLEGDMKTGIALTPHFVVSGDARSPAKPPLAPETVKFDFSSYSEQPLFSTDPNLEIFCDDRLAVKGQARLLSPGQSGANGDVAQFLAVEVSFKTFARMAQARRVRINLGPKRFDLMPDDISALSEMASHVRER